MKRIQIVSPTESGESPAHFRFSDLRGLAQLTVDAGIGVTRIVEDMTRAAWGWVLPGVSGLGAGAGTSAVFGGVYGVTGWVGAGVDGALATLEPWFTDETAAGDGSGPRAAVMGVLNGVVGDRLAAAGNPLAIPMGLRYRGRALDPQQPPEREQVSGRILVLIHGLCMSDWQWQAPGSGVGVDHGQALAAAGGYTPLYLRYNSGRHISENGRELSRQLEALVEHWPRPVEELAVIGHSMGGLLIRSAHHYAAVDGLEWPRKLKHIVFLGTPHHGAPLERLINWLDALWHVTPHVAPVAGLVRLRSAGITDLRYGNIRDEDWQDWDRFHPRPDTREVLPLPEGVDCHAIAATTAGADSVVSDRFWGDGLVPVTSALGRHDDRDRTLSFTDWAQRTFYGMNHFDLLTSPAVTEQLQAWLIDGPESAG